MALRSHQEALVAIRGFFLLKFLNSLLNTGVFMPNVSHNNTSCGRAHTCPHLHSIMMASHVRGLFSSLEVGSPFHRLTVRQSMDYALLQGHM